MPEVQIDNEDHIQHGKYKCQYAERQDYLLCALPDLADDRPDALYYKAYDCEHERDCSG